ncbi:MAG: DoxX family membrane protein [Chloroflexota bacterium]|nr:DoxX family membrane protein [Chloroflexota bacterium]
MLARLNSKRHVVQDPPLAQLLFSNTKMAGLWLVVRVWLGWQWLEAGWHKVTDAAWVDGGMVLKGFWTGAIQVPADGRPAIAFDWYREFIAYLLNAEAYTWFAPLVAWGEVLIGVGLIVGAFVGITAFFGAFMNWNFIMAGAASTNGLLLVLAIGLILAWKIAGYIGLDYILLPFLGTPWPDKSEEEVAVQPVPVTA